MVKLMSASVSLSSSAPGNLLPLKALCTGQRVVVLFVAPVAVSSDGKFVAAIEIEGQTKLEVFLCDCTMMRANSWAGWLAPFKCESDLRSVIGWICQKWSRVAKKRVMVRLAFH